MNQEKHLIIKISGEENLIDQFTNEIVSLHPIFVMGPIIQNDKDENKHRFITINIDCSGRVSEAQPEAISKPVTSQGKRRAINNE